MNRGRKKTKVCASESGAPLGSQGNKVCTQAKLGACENEHLGAKHEDEDSELLVNSCFGAFEFGGPKSGGAQSLGGGVFSEADQADAPAAAPGRKLTMTDEYFVYVEKYQRLYGKYTVVLLQNGSFFEMYGIDNEKEKIFPEIRQVCDVLDIYVSRKNKSILENGRSNPLMAGFPTWSYQKHVQNLLENEYTVVIFEQKEVQKGVFERALSEVLSPSIQLEYTSKSVDGIYCISFYVLQGVEYFSKVEFWTVSASVIDITTGRIFLYEITHSRMEKKESIFFDMIRLCKTHAPQEMLLIIDGEFFESAESYWRKHLGYSNTLHMIIVRDNGLSKIFENNVSIDKIRKLKYQIHFFNKVYSHISVSSSMDKISYCNLEHNDNMRVSLIVLLQFVYNHNRSLLDKISKPEWCEYLENAAPKFMKIENNSMEQIGLFSEGSKRKSGRGKLSCVFDVLNETKTAVGHRFLKESLCKPLVDVDQIKRRQRDIQIMKHASRNQVLDEARTNICVSEKDANLTENDRKDVKKMENKLLQTRENLSKICDLERIHRKIQLNIKGFSLCYEFSQLETSYRLLLTEVRQWGEIFSSVDDQAHVASLWSAQKFIKENLHVSNCMNTARNQNIELQIFNAGYDEKLDKLFETKEQIIKRIEIERGTIEKIIADYESEASVGKSSGGSRKKKEVENTQVSAEKKGAKRSSERKESNKSAARVTTKQIMLEALKHNQAVDKNPSAVQCEKKSGRDPGEDSNGGDAECEDEGEYSAGPGYKLFVKLECNEKEKFYFSITNSKCKVLQELCKKNSALASEYKIKMQVSNAKITNARVDRLNEEYSECLEHIDVLSKKLFQGFVDEFNKRYSECFTGFNYFLGYVDFVQSGAFVSTQNNYVCPIVVEDAKSFLECKELRHPLIEKILMYSMYVPNDICLGKEKNGYLIFGTNSCGKSVFMKSVGLAAIVAQIGYDVACKEMKFSPFKNVITRMSGNDDQLRGQSSFAVEMIELNLILSRSSPNSLILGDEICHGTEQVSGLSLVASALIHLCRGGVPFVFASHLHQLSKMECVLELGGLAMKHLTVKRQRSETQNALIYERKLKDGSGDATYGIEVAKYIIENQEFIYLAEKIQKVVEEREVNIVSERVSRYNRNLHMDKCQVCGSRAVETHHIIQQKDADEMKMVEASAMGPKISMNHFTNLVALCEGCHQAIHGKKGRQLQIWGYEDTASGLELKYEWKI
jgi:DNA mismatch repair ATPase MutS